MNPLGGTGSGGRGLRRRGGGAGRGVSVEDVASTLSEPSEGNLTDSSRFDSCERQR